MRSSHRNTPYSGYITQVYTITYMFGWGRGLITKWVKLSNGIWLQSHFAGLGYIYLLICLSLLVSDDELKLTFVPPTPPSRLDVFDSRFQKIISILPIPTANKFRPYMVLQGVAASKKDTIIDSLFFDIPNPPTPPIKTSDHALSK